jgi:hypothetical protein
LLSDDKLNKAYTNPKQINTDRYEPRYNNSNIRQNGSGHKAEKASSSSTTAPMRVNTLETTRSSGSRKRYESFTLLGGQGGEHSLSDEDSSAILFKPVICHQMYSSNVSIESIVKSVVHEAFQSEEELEQSSDIEKYFYKSFSAATTSGVMASDRMENRLKNQKNGQI